VAAGILASTAILIGQVEPPAPGPTPPPAAAKPRPPATVQTVMERIQERIDKELGPAPPPGRAARRTASTRRVAAAPAVPDRIQLTWRISLLWPDDLVHAAAAPAPPAPADVHVVWP
jgi:hypothetical protein